MTTTRTPALGGDFPQGNEPKASPARDEGERTNDYADLCERLGAVSALCRRDRRNTVALTLDEAARAIHALAALSPAQTGGTAVAWRWTVGGHGPWAYSDGPSKPSFPSWQPSDVRNLMPLYAAPVAEGARELRPIIMSAYQAGLALILGTTLPEQQAAINQAASAYSDLAIAQLQALDTGTNRGGGTSV